jgi:capsular polysaccharide biosynthesis protein
MATPALEVVRSGFATPTRFGAAPGPLAGCLHRSDGMKVELSERFGGYRHDWMRSENPKRVEPPQGAERLEGRGVYLGHDMSGHYGHFITEGLGAFWVFEEHPAAGFDFFLLHPFIFGTGPRPAHVRTCLERFGIDEDRVVLVGDAGVRFEEVVVPERLFRLNHSGDERLRWVYSQISRNAAPPGAPRVYLSRRRLSHTRFDRVVANESRIEDAFRRNGYTVIHPETMAFGEQVAHYRHAESMAGLSGSALHNCLFMAPGREVVELGDPRYGGESAPNQVVCERVAGVRSTFVPFRGRRFGPKRTMLFDVRHVERTLGWAPSAPRLRGLGEILYLSVRPALGHWAVRVRRRG